MLRIYMRNEKHGMLRRSLDNLAMLTTPQAFPIYRSLLAIERMRPQIDWTEAALKLQADRMTWASNDQDIAWALGPFFSASNGAAGGACR